MSYKTLDAFDIRQQWSWGTADAKLVLILDGDLLSDTGQQFEGGQIGGHVLSTVGFHWESAITITDGLATTSALCEASDRGNAQPAPRYARQSLSE